MTMHSSLRQSHAKKRHRSVLKRFERLSILMEKDKWKQDQSVFGLPKVKTLKVKIKKEKAPEAEAAVAEATAQAATTPETAAKPRQAAAPQTTAKPQAGKKEEKKK